VARLPEILMGLKERLGGNGRCCFIQTIPFHTQRLYKLVDWRDHQTLYERVVAAEETIYADAANPLVNWDEYDLEAAFQAADLPLEIVQERQVEERRISPAQLESWFTPETDKSRPSYGDHLLAAGITGDEFEQVARLYHGALKDQQIDWQTRIVYII
jgi:putative ATPase